MAPFCARLNDDVLQEIFLVSCPQEYFDLEDGYWKDGVERWIRRFPQFTISRVCSSWRQVALDTPQLWDSITITITTFTDTKFAIAREYLSRAKSRPVSVDIWGPERYDSYEQDWCSLLTDYLSSYRLRALILTLVTEQNKFYHILHNLHQWNVANLESLTIRDYGRPPKKSTIDLDHIRYPKLAQVRTFSIYKVSGLGTSLRDLYGKDLLMTVTEAWELLSHCPSLESIQFTLLSLQNDTHAKRSNSLPPIRLHRLHTLCLEAKPEIPFSTFIEALSLPVLKHLTFLDGRISWSSTAFQSFALQSDYLSHLKHLEIHDPSSATDMGVLLGSMSLLRSLFYLGIDSVVILDQVVLKGLASGLLAPRLEDLEVGCIQNQEELLGMVEQRRKNARMSSDGIPAPFKRVGFCTVFNKFTMRYV